MTVSHLYYNAEIHEASISYDKFKKHPEIKLDYDVNDSAFKSLLECMILGSKATFSYNPSTDEIKQYISISKGEKKIKDYNRY